MTIRETPPEPPSHSLLLGARAVWHSRVKHHHDWDNCETEGSISIPKVTKEDLPDLEGVIVQVSSSGVVLMGADGQLHRVSFSCLRVTPPWSCADCSRVNRCAVGMDSMGPWNSMAGPGGVESCNHFVLKEAP